MRKIHRAAIVLSLLLAAGEAQATTYYVNATSGDPQNGNGTMAKPFASLTQLATLTLAPGDAVLFNKGDTFPGSLTVNTSGDSNQDISFSAYGSGAAPIISGLVDVTGWSGTGTNLWEASVPGLASTPTSVLINGKLAPIARYPKASAANGGYLTTEGYSGNTSITDADLAALPNFAGGEVVIRMVHWLDYRTTITSETGTTLNFASISDPNPYALAKGLGYFVQNHVKAATQQGEWFYDAGTKKLGMYSVGAPTGVQASVGGDLITIAGKSHLTFDGLALLGSSGDSFKITGGASITIQNCDISFAGSFAVDASATSDLTISNNTIEHGISDGIRVYSPNATGITITQNTITDTGMVIGLSGSDRASNEAIDVNGKSGVTIERNTIKDTGYLPIRFNGSDVSIKNNVIDGYCSVLDDGAAIYTWDGPKTVFANRTIEGNIVTHGVGAAAGTVSGVPQANGIYLDNNANNVTITGNTVYAVANKGAHMNSPQNVVMKENTFFDNGSGFSLARWVDDDSAGGNNGQDISGLDIEDNIFFEKTIDQTSFQYTDQGLEENQDGTKPNPAATLADRIGTIGTIDKNYYYAPNPVGWSASWRNNSTTDAVFHATQAMSRTQFAAGYDVDASSIELPLFPGYEIVNLGTNAYPQGDFEGGSLDFGSYPLSDVTSTVDSGGKVNGTYSAKVAMSGDPTKRVLLYGNISGVTGGQPYILRVTTLGTNGDGQLTGFLRDTMTHDAITTKDTRPFGTTKTTHELLVTPSNDCKNASWELDLLEGSGTVYLDDIQVFPATVNLLKLDDSVRFEVNPTDAPTSVTLDQTYVDARGVDYCGIISLPAYSSLVLMKSADDCTPTTTTSSSSGNASTGSSPTSSQAGPGAAGSGGSVATGGAGGDGAGGKGSDQASGCSCDVSSSDPSWSGSALFMALGVVLVGRRKSHV